jgi:uncharacterized membrane protein
MLAVYGNDAYNVVLTLHILCAIIGFGAVFLNGLYGQQAKARKGPEGLAISEANMFVSKIGEIFIVAVLIFGLALVVMSDDVWSFEQTWIWLAIVIYVLAMGLSQGVMRPRVERMVALQRELVAGGPPPADAPPGPPPQVAEMEKIGKQMGVIGLVLNLALIAVLVLMVFKPGI